MMRVILVGLCAVFAAQIDLTAHAQTKEVIRDILNYTERRIIYEYYKQHGSSAVVYQDNGDGRHKGKKDKKGKGGGMPPGLAKRQSLPPGLAKQVRERGTLPPGLQKKQLPSDLIRSLPPVAVGQEIIVVGPDVILMEAATRKILDVFENVLLGAPPK